MQECGSWKESENPYCHWWDWWAQSSFDFDCDRFGFTSYNRQCNVQYTQQSCNMANFTCEMTYLDGNYQWCSEDCSGYMWSQTWWDSVRDSHCWLDHNHGELRYTWWHWEEFHSKHKDAEPGKVYGPIDDHLEWIPSDLDKVFTLFSDPQDTHASGVHHVQNPMCYEVGTHTFTNLDCNDFGVLDTHECTIQYFNTPCDMSVNSCTMYGYD